MRFTPTIGLEIHAELATKTKMFCDSLNDPDETRPNVNICPVCLAHPGTLPTINREAVLQVLRVGTALGGTLADFTEFDRKSYFYPDIPKGYQISQYAYPLVSGGALLGTALTRIHLEEDTARSIHAGGKSLVDFNRAGMPLMELVTEPDLHSAEDAGAFARELQLLLRTLGASRANLEKGEMRVEANISVSDAEGVLGTKVEVKNLNSFRAVERAIAYEVDRQSDVLQSGGTVLQETRGWNEQKQETFAQRLKEGSADYRYFPDPDLPKLRLSEIPEWTSEALRAALPELPWDRRARYEALGISAEASAYLAETSSRAAFFDAVCKLLAAQPAGVPLAANYLVSDLAGWYAKNGGIEYEQLTPETFAALVQMLLANDVSSRGAKELLALMAASGGEPRALAEKHGLLQVSDTAALSAAVESVIREHAAVADEYRAGKDAALQFLVGQAMRHMRGAGNPTLLRTLLIDTLARK
jgi:aspartyl-tRNA(Asn)/glutamyl-tRNA(Gln) amidotransferase subunit B